MPAAQDPDFDPSEPPLPAVNVHLLGHEDAEQEVLRAWLSGRMHHAWLITGKRGTGKATFAYKVARFLLHRGGRPDPHGQLFDDAPQNLDLPETSSVVRLVGQGAHPDLRVLQRQWDEKKKRRKGEIVVDEVRGIGGFLSLTASDGGWRVVIVDAADEMNRNAANAILKLLEEPPKRSILLLLAHNPARLLPTIRSRCRLLKLSPLADQTVTTLLARYCPDLSPDDVAALAAMGEGSVGRAIDLHSAGGLRHYQAMISLLRGLPKLDVLALHAFADAAIKGDEGFRITTTLFLWWLGRALAAAGRGESPAEVVPGENALIRTLSVSAPLDQWVQVWEKVSRLFERAEAVNLDKKQVLISAFGSIERLARPH